MPTPLARTGDPSTLSNLSTRDPNNLNVRGNGHFRIDQEEHWVGMKWVQEDADKLTRSAEDLHFGDFTAPSQERKLGKESEDILGRWTSVAYGASGEMPGRVTGPVQFVRKLMESWRLDESCAVSLLGYGHEEIEYVSAVLAGSRHLAGRDVKDRIAHLFCIRRTLWSLFRDLDEENDWLREGHKMLNGKSPLSLMLEGSMEDLLLVREFVELAAGIR